MKINDAGLALIKRFEGLRLESYRCPAGVLTIGYGSTGPHVKQGLCISKDEAEALLRKDLERFETGVWQIAGAATGNQFSAMVSLAFNIGLGAFATSTLVKRHKLGNHVGAANAFLSWHFAGGRSLNGLMKRREAERLLYLGEV